MGKIILKEPFKRTQLGEGRNFGIGFTIFKKVEKGLQPLVPFTACKDYLNDIVHIEKYNKITGTIYGFNYVYQNIFEHTDKCYLGFKVVPYNHQEKYHESKDIYLEKMKDLTNLFGVLNYFEDRLDITHTKLVEVENNTIILEFDKFWMKETFLMSLYTLLIRIYIAYEGEIELNSILSFKPIITQDEYMFKDDIKGVLTNIESLVKYKTEDYDFNYTNISSVHNHGIVGYINYIKTKK